VRHEQVSVSGCAYPAVGPTNTRAENSDLPVRRTDRAMLCFRRMRSLVQVVAVPFPVYNLFNSERSVSSRSDFTANRIATLTERRSLASAWQAALLKNGDVSGSD
jgi:hypothetical protein